MPRKHLIASQTNKKQQNQAKIWLKLSKEIAAAAKVGGPNPEANPRLKAAIDKALQNNLSRDSINKNINGAQKDINSCLTLQYECYGPHGLQIIVNALTDNQNRTASNLRGYLSKINGEIAKANSVKSFFNEFGIINLIKANGQTQDSILEDLMDFDIQEIIEFEDAWQILTSPKDFYLAKDHLFKKGYKINNAEISLVAQQKVSFDENDQTYQKIMRFIDACEDDDDIQSIITNLE